MDLSMLDASLEYKGIDSTPSSDPFETLVYNLSHTLGSCGLDEVDIEKLHCLMDEYTSTESEWSRYAFQDLSRGYTRNLVDEGNGKSNLLILVWTPGKGSPIHDHARAHCLMKVLKGSLKESRYLSPTSPGAALGVIKEKVYKEGQVTYMADKLGLHKISNTDPENVAVSLHLYTPPNAAKEGCNIFDERTGESSHVTQSSFYSEFGQRVLSSVL